MAVAQTSNTSAWKQNTGEDIYPTHKPKTSPKSRPDLLSPRYVRTWSQEEDIFLLEARKSRIPYKDIAARLNKTDLACRLHYHQIVVAKKNIFIDNDTSVPAPMPEQYPTPFQYHSRSESLPPISTTISPRNMLLPAPVMRDSLSTGSGSVLLRPSHRRAVSYSYTTDKKSPSFSPMNGIHKRGPPVPVKGHNTVDIDQIQKLYRDFAPDFWSNIAAAYSHERPLSSSEIENAFWQGQCVIRPEPLSPTSDARSTSPASSWPSANSTTSITTSQVSNDDILSSAISLRSPESSKERCSVSAILND